MKLMPFKLRYAAFGQVAGLPSLEDLGFERLSNYSGIKAFHANPSPPPSASKDIRIPGFRDFLLEHGFTDSVIDIEHVGTRFGHPQVAENAAILHQIIDIHDAALPNAKFGIYGSAAVAHLHHNNATDAAYLAAREEHLRQWVKPLVDRMDYVITQAYTLDDQHSLKWLPVVMANIATAKAITDRPVQVWLKPRYNIHVAAFKNQPIPYAQWRLQLEELAELLDPTDQVVFWEGAIKTFSEFDRDNWYQATVDFIAAQPDDTTQPPPPPPPESMIGVTGRGVINASTDATSFATPAFTPGAQELLVACYSVARDASMEPTTPTVIGHDGGIPWTLIAEHSWNTVDSNRKKLFLFACVTGNTPGSGSVTFDHGGVSHLAAEASVFEVSGADELNGLTQTFVQTVLTAADPVAAGDMSLTLAPAGHPDNRPFLWVVHEKNEDMEPRANWTEIHDVNHLSPIMGAESQWRSDAFETTTSASWSTGVKFGGMAFEIKAFVAPTPPPPPPPDPIPPPTCEEELATAMQDLEEALARVDVLTALVDEAATEIIALETETILQAETLALQNETLALQTEQLAQFTTQISALEEEVALKSTQISTLELDLVLKTDQISALEAALALKDDKLVQVAAILEQTDALVQDDKMVQVFLRLVELDALLAT